nr:unnamed protein product [Digitaria exilis]
MGAAILGHGCFQLPRLRAWADGEKGVPSEGSKNGRPTACDGVGRRCTARRRRRFEPQIPDSKANRSADLPKQLKHKSTINKLSKNPTQLTKTKRESREGSFHRQPACVEPWTRGCCTDNAHVGSRASQLRNTTTATVSARCCSPACSSAAGEPLDRERVVHRPQCAVVARSRPRRAPAVAHVDDVAAENVPVPAELTARPCVPAYPLEPLAGKSSSRAR